MSREKEYEACETTLREILVRSIVTGNEDFADHIIKKAPITLSKGELFQTVASALSLNNKNTADFAVKNEEKLRAPEPDDEDRLHIGPSRDNPESITLKWKGRDHYTGLLSINTDHSDAKKKNSLSDPFNGHPKTEAEILSHLPSQFLVQPEKAYEAEGKGKQQSSKVLLTTTSK